MAIDWDDAVLSPLMAVFGDVVTYRPLAGGSYDIADAAFDENYHVVLDGEDGAPPVASTMPALGVRRAAMQADPVQSDVIDIPAKGRFMVREPKPDGIGHVLMLLSYVGPIP